MYTTLRRLRYAGLIVPTLLMLLFANVGSTLAAGTPVSVILAMVGGVLTAVPGPAALGGYMTAGSQISYTVPIAVTDTTGTGHGWHLTMTSTQFADSTGTMTLPTSISTIDTTPGVKCLPQNCVMPINNIVYPIMVPANTAAPLAVSFFNAAPNSGMGIMTVTPTINVSLPITTLLNTYTSVLTLDIVSGP